MTTSLPRLLFPALLGAALAAQDTTTRTAAAANRFVPEDSVFAVRIAAPSVWKRQFQKTQVVKLLQAPHAAPLIAELTRSVDAGIEALRQSGKVDADLIAKLLTSYGGDLTFSIQVDWDDVATSMQEDRPPHFSMVLALSPDGDYDLAGLATTMQKLIEDEAADGHPMKDLTAGDVKLRVVTEDEDIQSTLPTIVDGHMVMLFGSDLEGSATRLLANDKRFGGDIPNKPLWVHAKLDRLMATLIETIETQLDASGMMPVEIGPILRKTGLAALDHLSFSVDADGAHTNAAMQVAFGDGDLGFMGAMMTQGRPKLLRFLPAGCEQFTAGHFDVNAFYKVARDVWNDLGDAVPLTVEDAEAAFAENLKVRLKEDLLAHCGTELLTLQADVDEIAGEDDDEQMMNPIAALGGACLVFELRDGKAFAQNLETALRARGMHAARKSEDYADTKIYQLRIGGFIDTEYAVTDDMLLVVAGKGESGRRSLRGVLDAKKRGGEAELPAAVQKHLAAMPEGWSGVGLSPVAGFLVGLSTGLSQASADDEAPPELGRAAEALRKVAGDLRQLGIENVLSVNYVKARSIESRYRW